VNKRSATRFISLGSIVVLSGLLLLTGCSPTAEPKGFWGKLWKIEVGPDYKRPDPEPVQEFRSQIGPAENASLADLPWWGVIKDPQLQQLVAVALAHNYDLQLAVARVDQARSLVWVAASPFYPQAGYQAFAGRERIFLPNEEAGGNLTYNAFGALLNATWEIDVWGRIRRSTEAARANLFAQEDVRRGVMLTLVSDVATGYFRMLELDRELAIAQDSSRTYKKRRLIYSRSALSSAGTASCRLSVRRPPTIRVSPTSRL
jgi:outer membrane protein TolC